MIESIHSELSGRYILYIILPTEQLVKYPEYVCACFNKLISGALCDIYYAWPFGLFPRMYIEG